MTTPSWLDHAAEAESLSIIARFAMAQEEAGESIDSYLDCQLSEAVVTVVRKRLRWSDDERLSALVAVANTVGYPLHIESYKLTWKRTKNVRDHLAHGGPPLVGAFEDTKEPVMWAFSKSDRVPGGQVPHVYSLTDLRSVANDARWLYLVAWRVHTLITGEVPSSRVRYPSDIPRSAALSQPANRGGWGTPPICPNGHANVYGVETTYGDAWLCGHCDHIRLRDESQLAGSRAVLEPQAESDGA